MTAGAHRARATTWPDLLDRAADHWSHDALVLDSERVTFADLAERSLRRARALRARGVGPGDNVGILAPNSVEYLVTVFGTARLGATPVPINHRFRATELAHVIVDAELRVLLVADAAGGRSYVETATAASDGAEAPELRHVLRLDAALDAGADEVGAAEVARLQSMIRIRDRALIIYTSGTTAKPRGCVLNHEGITRTAFTVANERFAITPDDRFWDPLPFCHLSSLALLNACLAGGGTFVSMARFEPGPALVLLEGERCTMAYPCFDTVTAALQDDPAFEQADLSALRLAVTIGVPERLEAMQRRWPHVAQLGAYGATEYSGVLCFNCPDDPLERRIHTCGPPIPGMEIKIVDPETGAPVPDGERGELYCRGYGVFEGYYRDPAQTARVLDTDGWMRSGDLVSKDSDDYVSYHGRLKDMLKVGGENVAAAEIEGVLLTHPDVREAQVVAAPDAKYVEVPAAFLELRAGARVTEADVVEFCSGQLAAFKLPRYVRFVDKWPMSGTKIMKVPLRESIAVELARAHASTNR